MNVLQEAQALVLGDRNADYGHPRQEFERIARLWSAYTGATIFPEDVPMMLILLKAARERHAHKRDNLVDIAGYALCAELAKEPKNPMPEFGA